MITRRKLFGTVAAIGAAVVAAVGFGGTAGPAAAANEIRVLNWQGYGSDEPFAVQAFEKMTGYKVVHDYFNSEQEMLTKLRTSPGSYDVVLMNNNFVPQAVSEGLVQAIDTSKVTHFKDLNPTLRDSTQFVHDGKYYAISWVWGVTAAAYNKDKVKPAPDSLAALWDPAHAGRVTIRDDAREAVEWAAMAIGDDMNDPKDLEKIKEKLKALKPQIKKLWSTEDDWNKDMQAGQFDLGTYWLSATWRAQRKFNLPVEPFFPKEGAIGWFDGMAVAKGAPHADIATAFIDYMVSPEFYVKWQTEVGAPISANIVADSQLPANDPARALVADKEALSRIHFVLPVSDDKKKQFQEMWDEVKAYYAQ